jgi:hypothetical protein
LSASPRLLERIGDGERDVLPVIAHDVVLERRAGLVDLRHLGVEFPVGRRAKDLSEVAAMVDRANARHLLRSARVDAAHLAIRDGGAHRHGVHHAGKMMVRAVHRPAAHLQRTVDARLLLADDGRHRDS